MENRFGFKDFLILAFLGGVIVSIWLAMKQYDRQWEDLKQLKTQVGQLTGEQAAMRNEVIGLKDLIQRGVKVAGSAAEASGAADEVPISSRRIAAARKTEGFAEGDWIIDAFGANLATITPYIYKDYYARRIHDYTMEGLVESDPVTLEDKPLLAKSWKMSADGLKINFQLRQNTVFSDGHPITSEDVVYAHELLNNPKLDAASHRTFYNNIIACKALGPFEVEFTLREPHFQAVGMCGGLPVLPRHFYSQFTIEEINKSTGLLLGSGPYRMNDPKGWAPGKQLELVRNERYWGVKPGPSKLVFREINSDVTRLTMYRNKEIDLFAAIFPEQYRDLLKDKAVAERSHALEYYLKPAGYSFIAWNEKRNDKPTIFADKRVRQAMTLLTDRPRIARDIYLGYAKPAVGPWTEGSPQCDPSIKAHPYDPARAKQLLKQAGWEDRNGDGVLENARGEMFKFKFTYPSGSAVYDRVMLILKDSYTQSGVLMELDPLEWSVFHTRLDEQSFDAVTMAWGGGAIESDPGQNFHSTQAVKGGDNFMSYLNPELDKTVEKARRELDKDKRMELWRQIHRIVHEDQPYTFMLTRMTLWLVDKRVQNIQKLPTGVGLNDRVEWFVPQGMQRWTQ